MEEIRELIEKYALQNAVKYNAAPKAGAVMGKLMGGAAGSGFEQAASRATPASRTRWDGFMADLTD